MSTPPAKRLKEAKEKEENNHHDRISELPVSLIVVILSLLPTKEAARTSLRSRNWRRCWTLLPHLTFRTPGCSQWDLKPRTDAQMVGCKSKWIGKQTWDRALSKLLASQSGPLRRCRIDTCKCLPSETKIWIEVLADKEIEELELHFDGYGLPDVHIPMFSFHLLTSLKLSQCTLDMTQRKLAVHLEGFPNLKHLDVYRVVFLGQDAFVRLIRSCSVLEKLHVYHCELPRKLPIHCAALKDLVLCEPHCEAELEVSAPKLERFYGGLHCHPNSFSTLIAVAHVKILTLGTEFLLGCGLPGLSALGSFCNSFDDLRHLTVEVDEKGDKGANALLTFMLKNSPRLRQLCVYKNDYHTSCPDPELYRKHRLGYSIQHRPDVRGYCREQQQLFHCLIHSLEYVHFCFQLCIEGELWTELPKLLLLNSPALKKMSIETSMTNFMARMRQMASRSSVELICMKMFSPHNDEMKQMCPWISKMELFLNN